MASQLSRLVFGASLILLAQGGCEKNDPKYTKGEFATAMGEATCRWSFSCCDGIERQRVVGDVQDESECVTQVTARYTELYRDAGTEEWSGTGAVACADEIEAAADTCPRGFDPDAAHGECTLVAATLEPGDLCSNTWDCSTKFCKGGVCANPLPDGSPCEEAEPCASGLRCISGTCQSLQPDGAECQAGDQCISGACGAGQCVTSANYTCDGR